MPLRKPFEKSYYPPLPTRWTRYWRTNIPWQFLRFLLLNVKMLRMVRKH